MKYELILDTG